MTIQGDARGNSTAEWEKRGFHGRAKEVEHVRRILWLADEGLAGAGLRLASGYKIVVTASMNRGHN